MRKGWSIFLRGVRVFRDSHCNFFDLLFTYKLKNVVPRVIFHSCF